MSVRRMTRDERHAIDEQLRALLRRGDPAASDALTPDEVRTLRRATLAAAEPAGLRQPWLAVAGPAFAAALALLAAVTLWRLVPEGGLGVVRGKTDQVRKEAGPQPPHRAQSDRAWRHAPRPAPDHLASDRGMPDRSGTALQAHTPFPTQPAFDGPASTKVQEHVTATARAALHAEPLFPTQPIFRLFLESTPVAEPVATASEPAAVPSAGAEVASAAEEAVEVPGLHLEFSAPGGTRIIWTLTSPSES